MKTVRLSKLTIISTLVVMAALSSSVAFAASQATFFMQNWLTISLNDDPVVLPKITITDNAGGEITAKNGIGILIDKETKALWDKTVKKITIDGVLRDVTYSSDLKRVSVSVQADMVVAQQLVIEGLTMRVYDQGISYRNFFVDINNDGVGDFEGTNGFSIDSANRRTDRTAPFEVESLASAYEDGKVVISWVNPLDYDLDRILITRDLTRADGTKDQSVVALDRLSNRYEDGAAKAGESIKYTVITKDYNDNSSAGVVFDLIVSELLNPAQVNVTLEIVEPIEVVVPAVVVDADAKSSLRDGISDADISAVVTPGSGLLLTSDYVKDVVYLVKNGWLKADYRGNFRLVRHLKYGEFADIVGQAFGVEVPGMSRNSYYFAMKKMEDLLPVGVNAGERIKREDAFRIILKLAGLKEGEQTIVSDVSSLSWYATRKELAHWIVEAKSE